MAESLVRLAVQIVRFVVALPRRVLIAIFRLWQLLVSPTYGQTCRFYPSCSVYGVEAVTTHGALRGLALTGWRILRCNPWNPGGVDLVPPRGDVAHHACSDTASRTQTEHHHSLTEVPDSAVEPVLAADVVCPDETAPPARRAA